MHREAKRMYQTIKENYSICFSVQIWQMKDKVCTMAWHVRKIRLHCQTSWDCCSNKIAKPKSKRNEKKSWEAGINIHHHTEGRSHFKAAERTGSGIYRAVTDVLKTEKQPRGRRNKQRTSIEKSACTSYVKNIPKSTSITRPSHTYSQWRPMRTMQRLFPWQQWPHLDILFLGNLHRLPSFLCEEWG